MFKESFKYYKAKCLQTDLTAVVDVDKVVDDDSTINIVKPLEINSVQLQNCNNSLKSASLGLKPISEWKLYEIKSNQSGLIFIRNPFTSNGQRYWIAKCLRDYPKAPHITNLHTRNDISKFIIDDWWTSAVKNDNDKIRRPDAKRKHKNLKQSLRWVTLGYHHDWNTKIYRENNKNKFPIDLAKLTTYFATILNYDDYKSEAAIVNYYPIGTTLAGHTDHSEVNLNAPLFSFSFGQSAIFLIGGKTQDEKPTAIFLKSGDVIVMSKESRLCYHAVPKILKTNDTPWNVEFHEDILSSYEDTNLSENNVIKRRKTDMNIENILDRQLWRSCCDRNFWVDFENYIKDCRININSAHLIHGFRILLLNQLQFVMHVLYLHTLFVIPFDYHVVYKI